MADNNTMPVYPGWETVRKIGTGSFGSVYEIQRNLFGRIEKAALKKIPIPQNESDVEELYSNGYDSASITEHFKSYLEDIVREYFLMAEMKGHTNVVYCDDIRYEPKSDGFGWDIYIKMELLTPLIKVVDSIQTEDQIIRLGKDICRALILCENKNIIHRDIKPQNIFVSKDGDYKLGDFGIAKTIEKTSGGTKIGTYTYMAPEVYNNMPYGHAADIYSLGLVLYWLLNERRTPFLPLPPAVPKASDMEEAKFRRFGGEEIPEPYYGSDELKQIVLKACAFDSQDRYDSAAEMLEDLELIETSQHQWLNREKTAQVVQDGSTKTHYSEETIVDNSEEDGTIGAFYRRTQPKNAESGKNEEVQRRKVVAWTKEDKTQFEKRKKHRKGVTLVKVALIIALAITGYYQIHIWAPATCTDPEQCRICGRIRNPALGHDYSEATCFYAEKCKVCGSIGKPALGHDLTEATYEEPATCNRCGLKQGHVKGFVCGKLSGTWSDKYVNLKYWSVSPLILDRSVENCRSFTLNLSVSNITSGSPYGDWQLYGKSKQGKWFSLGKFIVDKNTIKVDFLFDKPVTFTALVTERLSSKACSHSFTYWLENVQQYVDS